MKKADKKDGTRSPVFRKNRAAASTIESRYRQKYFKISMKMNGN